MIVFKSNITNLSSLILFVLLLIFTIKDTGCKPNTDHPTLEKIAKVKKEIQQFGKNNNHMNFQDIKEIAYNNEQLYKRSVKSQQSEELFEEKDQNFQKSTENQDMFDFEVFENAKLFLQKHREKVSNKLGRHLADYDPCLEYDADDSTNCIKCDYDNEYYLLLFNTTHTICGTNYYDYYCLIDEEYYPVEAAFANSIYDPWYWWQDTAPSGLQYCWDFFYYMTEEVYDYVCDSVPILYEIDDVYLSTVYTRTDDYCVSCSTSPYLNAELAYYDALDIVNGICTEQTYQCSYTQYYDADSGTCIECTETFKYCAACTATECLMCLENFYWNDEVYDYETQDYHGECIFDTCPVGYCQDTSTATCTESSDPNCLKCYTTITGYYFDYTYWEYVYTYDDYCQLCGNGYYNDGGDCEAFGTTETVAIRYVTSEVPVTDSDCYDLTSSYYCYYSYYDGLTPQYPGYLLMEVYNDFMEDYQYDSASIDLTIYVGKGDHFMFICDGDEYYLTYLNNDTDTLEQWCTGNSYLTRQDLINDNIKVTIEALDCAYATTLGYSGNSYFEALCVDFDAGEEKPTIFVQNERTYFNISGSLTVKNLKFSGINALAVPAITGYNLAVFPILLCDISKEPNGMDSTISLEKQVYDDDYIEFTWTCEDPYYTGSSVPKAKTNTNTCTANSNSQFSSESRSTLACGGEPTNSNYFLQSTWTKIYFKRRSTLFNIYAFPQHTTLRDQIPELHITNCDFEYFLQNYESLINVETNSLSRVLANNTKYSGYYSTEEETRGYYYYNQADRGAKIEITSSTFKHSRFCKGMIYYRQAPYEGDSRALCNLTHLYMDTPVKQDNGSYIKISYSTFKNLNAFTNVTAIAIYGGEEVYEEISYNSIDSVYFPSVIHKGIVLNIEDFNGYIEIIDCTFDRNFHFIPEIYYNFHLKSDTITSTLFEDSSQTRELQLSMCNPTSFSDDYFFNLGFGVDQDLDQFFDDFGRLGVIYISRNKQKVIIKDNYFTKNIGTHGGAITINSPNWAEGQYPYVVIYNNDFERNMAYFSGNAIYIRNTMKSSELDKTCAGVFIKYNTFTNNIGMKFHNGGAISAYCAYLTDTTHQDYFSSSGYDKYMNASNRTDLPTMIITTQIDSTEIKIERFRFSIKSNDFTQNFSGLKGTAIYIKHMSDVLIENCTFLLNGPVTAVTEQYYSPYVGYLSQHSITFYDQNCFDEYEFLEACYTVGNSYIDFPRVQGAVHVIFCQTSVCLNSNYLQALEISSSDFVKNEAGPILEDLYTNTEATSSNIHIVGGFYNYISECNFYDNKGTTFFYTNMKTSNITKFFPDGVNYFYSSMSSLINIYLNPTNPQDFVKFNTTITDCKFYRNQNTQVVGLTSDQIYKGSIVKIVNSQSSATLYQPILNIAYCKFRENIFVGTDSSLIYSKNAILKLKYNEFVNNGYISTSSYSKSKSDITLDSTEFIFSTYTFYKSQQYGTTFIEGDIVMPNNDTHLFEYNNFTFLFSQYGTAYALGIDNQQAQITSNSYQYLFAQNDGSLLYGYSTSGRSTIYMEKENIKYLYSQYKGAIVIQPTAQDLMNLYVIDSKFDNVQSYVGQAFYLLMAAKVNLENITLTRSQWHSNNTAFVLSQFKSYQQPISYFAQQSLFLQILNKVTQYSGYIFLKDILNSQSVTFAGKTLISSSYKYISYVEILNSKMSNSYTQYATIIDSSTSNIRISNTYATAANNIIYNNTGLSTGCFQLSYSSILVGENIKFYNNTSKYKASTMILSGSSASFINTTFLENNSSYIGTALIESNSNFVCNYCYFIRNYAYDTSTIFGYNNIDTSIIIKYSTFLNNTSTSNLINYLYSKGTISQSTFIDNISEKVNNGLTLVNSKVNISNILVNFTNEDYVYNNQYLVDTGFFNLNYQSEILIENSILANVRGAIGALLYATGSSIVQIKSNTVIENVFSKTGSVIYATMTEKVSIFNSYFKNNSQTDVYLEITEGFLGNNYFYKGVQNSVWATSAQVTMYNNTFLNGTNTGVYGKALWCYCDFMNITNNTFQNLNAVGGGAIFLYSTSTTSNFTIKGNNFINNVAQQGGAIYIQDAANLTLSGNYFYGNKAQVIYPKTTESSKLTEKGLGGSIYFACSNDEIQANGGCIVNLVKSNNFLSNYAENDGGGILWISNAYNDDGSNKFRNNSAFYGDDVASYPKSIYVEFLNNNDYYNNYTVNETSYSSSENRRRRLESNSSFIPTFVSGTAFDFNVYILDQNGNVYKTDSSSKAAFKYDGTSRVTITQNEVIASEGVYYFKNVEVSAVPGSTLKFKLEITGLQTYDNDIDFLDVPFSFNLSLRYCIQGEQYTSDNRCDKCAEGTYLYFPPTLVTACKECPSHAMCYGGYLVAPETGYWRSSNISENFIACPNPLACNAGNETNPTGICADGYKGILCGDCDDNYSKTQQFECSECPERVRNIVQIIFMMIAAVFYVGFVVRSTLNSSDKEKPVHSVYLKIMTNHFQVLSAISNIEYNWPEEIEKFTENENQISSVSDQIFSFDCFLMSGGKDNGPIPVYYQKLIMYGLAPLIMAAGDIAFWLLVGAIKRNYGDLKSKFTSTLVVLLFLVHPNIVKAMFLSFNCVQVDEDFRLKENVSSICYKSEHLTYIMIISMPSVLIWAIGIPLFAFILLRANKQSLLLQDKKIVTETENEKQKIVKMKYGFIFIGYRGAAYYWEVILMYRKVGIIMSTVFLSTLSNETQVLAVMLIIIASMLLQIKYDPYNTKILNQMEIYSLTVAAITLYSGMYYITGQHYSYMDNEGLSWFFLIFIVSPNAVFFAYWGYYMRIEVLKQVHQRKKPKLFKLVACMTQDRFHEKYIQNDITRVPPQTIVPDDHNEQQEQQEEQENQQEDVTDEITSAKKMKEGEPQNSGNEERDSIRTEDINLEFYKLRRSTPTKKDQDYRSNYTEDENQYSTQRTFVPKPRESKVHPLSTIPQNRVRRKPSESSINNHEQSVDGMVTQRQEINEEAKFESNNQNFKKKKGYSKRIMDKLKNLKIGRKSDKYQETNELDVVDIKPKLETPKRNNFNQEDNFSISQLQSTSKKDLLEGPQPKGDDNLQNSQQSENIE